MNSNEIAAQLEFFRDIGVDTLEASPSGRGRREAQARQGEASREAAAGEGLSLDSIRAEIGDCQRCKLAPTRTNIVFGSGNPHAELVFVGEAPGYDEDQQGLPFVGRAGQLLHHRVLQPPHGERRQVPPRPRDPRQRAPGDSHLPAGLLRGEGVGEAVRRRARASARGSADAREPDYRHHDRAGVELLPAQ